MSAGNAATPLKTSDASTISTMRRRKEVTGGLGRLWSNMEILLCVVRVALPTTCKVVMTLVGFKIKTLHWIIEPALFSNTLGAAVRYYKWARFLAERLLAFACICLHLLAFLERISWKRSSQMEILQHSRVMVSQCLIKRNTLYHGKFSIFVIVAACSQIGRESSNSARKWAGTLLAERY